jgi:hypothetical protein
MITPTMVSSFSLVTTPVMVRCAKAVKQNSRRKTERRFFMVSGLGLVHNDMKKYFPCKFMQRKKELLRCWQRRMFCHFERSREVILLLLDYARSDSYFILIIICHCFITLKRKRRSAVVRNAFLGNETGSVIYFTPAFSLSLANSASAALISNLGLLRLASIFCSYSLIELSSACFFFFGSNGCFCCCAG